MRNPSSAGVAAALRAMISRKKGPKPNSYDKSSIAQPYPDSNPLLTNP
jgi:hypothetical protein